MSLHLSKYHIVGNHIAFLYDGCHKTGVLVAVTSPSTKLQLGLCIKNHFKDDHHESHTG